MQSIANSHSILSIILEFSLTRHSQLFYISFMQSFATISIARAFP